MHRARLLSAWVMLLAFAAGGLVGPSVHRAHHAAERAAQVQSARTGACHTDAAHYAGAPAAASDVRLEDALDCTLCATRHHVVPPVEVAPPAPSELPVTWAAGSDRSAPSLVSARTVIRGPPHL